MHRHFLLFSYALILFWCLASKSTCKADDSPGFFVKISKNVPRLGRRSDKTFGRGFLNNYKVIPRIGRSFDSVSMTKVNLNNILIFFFLTGF